MFIISFFNIYLQHKKIYERNSLLFCSFFSFLKKFSLIDKRFEAKIIKMLKKPLSEEEKVTKKL